MLWWDLDDAPIASQSAEESIRVDNFFPLLIELLVHYLGGLKKIQGYQYTFNIFFTSHKFGSLDEKRFLSSWAYIDMELKSG